LNQPVIIEAIRTPFGRRKGALRESRPDKLLATIVDVLLQRSGLAKEKAEDLIAGCVSQAGEQAANVGRLAALLAGLPSQVPGVTLNRMCGSSQQALHFAAQAIGAGDMKYVIAGGVESMTRVPMFLDLTLGRHDFRGFDDLNPEILAKYPMIHQVESAERIAEQRGITRAECDQFAVQSHRRAQDAAVKGYDTAVVATAAVDAAGTATLLTRDEGVRAAIDVAKMEAMAPVFRKIGEGVITAANASQMSDGASAVLVADEATARADGLRPLARFRARVAVGSDPIMQLTGVLPATELALKRTGLSIKDLDWIEINEAFASVVLAWEREFSPDMSKVNPWGGAIAHGHPLGATGTALMAKMLCGLKATGGTLGLQVMCIGHGMGTATIIERIE
jgi:acetyl-CoA acyltransferase